jgi:SAM-dependent methyltransferase
MPAQSHRSDPRILGRRTLERDHRCLAGLLRLGFSVLDIGCGTGAITAGIAQAVGPHGQVVGLDRDPVLVDLARSAHSALPNLKFDIGDGTSLSFRSQFDIVTAARTLQWIAAPALAIANMKQASKPAGMLVILDYNHADNQWEPDPPPAFQRFYSAFLAWRESNCWDNRIADHLPELFRSAGLANVETHLQDEVTERGELEFVERSALWSEVIDNVGAQIISAELCTRHEWEEARDTYRAGVKTELVKQTLVMRAVTAVLSPPRNG